MAPHSLSRRDLFAAAAAVGIGSTTFHRAVAAEAIADPAGPVTAEMVKNAEWIAGIELTEDQRKQVAGAMTRFLNDFAVLHKVEVGNHVAPALHFNADPWHPPVAHRREPMPAVPVDPKLERPEADEDLAFLPLVKLAGL